MIVNSRVCAFLYCRFRPEPTSHWLQVLEGSGIAYGPINDLPQVFSDPQVCYMYIHLLMYRYFSQLESNVIHAPFFVEIEFQAIIMPRCAHAQRGIRQCIYVSVCRLLV